MNRFGLILFAVMITVIGAVVTSLVWTGTASADGNGELTFVEVQKDGVGGVDGLAGAVPVTVSLDGKHLYAAGNADDAPSRRRRLAATTSFLSWSVNGKGRIFPSM